MKYSKQQKDVNLPQWSKYENMIIVDVLWCYLL